MTIISVSKASAYDSSARQDADSRFLRQLTVATGGGMFIDGFVFASFAAALAGVGMTRALNVTTTWATLISTSTLIGTFFGGLLLGYVTDRIGRKPMFTIDLSVFLGCAVLMFFVTANWHIFVLGLVMGLAVGADYSIGSPLLGEFTPNKRRGHLLGVLEIAWNVGYVTAYLIGYIINTHFPDAWHVILGVCAVPAIICLAVRHGLPESPRWLISKGRRDEANTIISAHVTAEDLEDYQNELEQRTDWRELFRPDYLRRTIFACTFWICIVLPYFALIFFQAKVLKAIGLGESALIGALIGTVVALLGATTGWLLVDRIGRRKILIGPMMGCAVFLYLVSLDTHLPVALAAFCFFGYLFSYGIMSILPGIYPEEIFPTSVRSAGVGVATAASRAGAAVGTFALPHILNAWGLTPLMIIMGTVSLIGGITSHSWAPETNGRALTETSHRQDPHRYGRRRAVLGEVA